MPLGTVSASAEQSAGPRESPLQALADDGDVVERDLAPVLELLALLVAFAGDHHHVPRLRTRDGLADRLSAVDTPGDVWTRPGEDLDDDRLGVFGSRVVRGDDDAVGEPPGDLTHRCPLAGVAISARTEDHVHASAS
jgi:hypothetical protein